MRPTSLATTLLTSALCLTTAHAQLVPFFTNSKSAAQHPNDPHQRPMADPNNAPGIQLPPPPPSSNNKGSSDRNDEVILSDVLGTPRQISIFASFCRDVSSISQRLDTSGLNTTVLAPLNSAISSLPRKPWEDPEEYRVLGDGAYAGQGGEERAQRNLRRFVEAHVVGVSPWGEGERVRTVGGEDEGREVWWERDEAGTVRVMPDGVEVDGVVQRVKNGEVWVLKGVVNYASSDKDGRD